MVNKKQLAAKKRAKKKVAADKLNADRIQRNKDKATVNRLGARPGGDRVKKGVLF